MSYPHHYDSHGHYIFSQMPPQTISHKFMGLVCPNDRPPMFGPLVSIECPSSGSFAYPYHRKLLTLESSFNCGVGCTTSNGCVCKIQNMSSKQPPKLLPLLNPIYPLDSTIFVD